MSEPPPRRPRGRDAGRSSTVGADDALETLVNQFSDPLVFLRELVQNSLDAASTRIDVDFAYSEDDGLMTITVADNGEGMNESVIDRYLLTLFRSTKENDLTKIGKFGVGFVSVFAIGPDLLVLDTGQAGESWRIIFHPDRSFEKLRLDAPVEGTSIALYKRVEAAEFTDLAARGADTVRYWCKYAEAEILVNGEDMAEDFGLDAVLAVAHEEPGTQFVVGFAPARRALDPERQYLNGAAAATALAPLIGFYNRGLTLIESAEAPNAGGRESDFLAGLSVRVKSRYLEHTLTRDNVRQDENYAKAMKLVRATVEGALRDKLVAHLEALAAHRCDAGADPGAPDLEMALLYARLPCMRLHETWPRAAIVPTLGAAPVSVQALRDARSPTGSVLFTSERNPVTRLLSERGVPVVLEHSSVREHLRCIGVIPAEPGADSDLDRALVTAVPVALDPAREAWLERVKELLTRARLKVDRVVLGDLGYAGSPVANNLLLRQERAFELTRRGHDDKVTFFGGARDMVLNANNELVAGALALLDEKPQLAAQLVSQAVCMIEGADPDRTVELTWDALGWRDQSKGRS